MGFGHRVYKNYDPRAKIIKWAAEQVFEVTGRNPKLEIALELERIALEDDYFIKRKLYPNVDFYSGHHLPGHGLQAGDVYRAVCHPAHSRLAGAMAGDAYRSGAEDRPSAASLHGTRCARVLADGKACSDREHEGLGEDVSDLREDLGRALKRVVNASSWRDYGRAACRKPPPSRCWAEGRCAQCLTAPVIRS